MTIFADVLSLIFQLVALAFLVFIFGRLLVSDFIVGVPGVNSKGLVVGKIREIGLRSGSLFMDLGCNNGTLIGELARLFPEVRFVGLEKNPFSFWVAKLMNHLFYKNRLVLKNQDIFESDISQAHYLYVYLTQRVVDALTPYILENAAPGTLVICNIFPLKNVEATRIVPTPKASQKIWLYQL